MNEARDKQKGTMQDLAREDLTLSMLETMIRYRDNVKDPRMQAELKEAIESHNKSLIEMDLKNENDKVISTAHIEKSINRFNTAFENELIRSRQTGTWDPASLGTTILRILNKNYKGLTIGPAIGRVIMETAQAGVVATIENLDTLLSFRVPEGLKIPEAGNINKNVKFSAREFQSEWNIFGSNLLTWEKGKVEAMLSKPADFFLKVQAWIMDPSLSRIENWMYHSLFQKKMIEKAMEMDGYKWSVSWWTPGKSSYLFKDNVTSANQVRKNHIVQEIKRKARTEASKMFFNYADNPLYIQKMEQLVPFTNYIYSWVRTLSRYPKSMLFSAVMLNNLTSAYWEEVWYVDDQGEKVDAGISLRMPILASIGLGGVGINLQKMLTFSPGNTSISPLPIFSYLTNREDFRFKTFYETGSVDDLLESGMATLGGSIGRLFKWIKNLNEPYNPAYNPVADLTSTLAYIATGFPIKDKTQQLASKAYFEKDIDFLLSLSDMQLTQFFKRPGREWLNRRSLEMAQKALDLGLITKDYKWDPNRAVLETITWMWIDVKSFSKDDYNHTVDMMENMLEVVLWKQFSYTNPDFEAFLGKAIAFADTKWFKAFEAFNPKLYDTYKHFADNRDYYYGQWKAYKLMWSTDDTEKKKGQAMMFALQYKFEWDDEMTIEEKTNGIMYSKLKKVQFAKGIEWIPDGPALTEWYFNSLNQKWALTINYLNQANEVIALTKARKLFNSLAYIQPSTTKKNEYFNLANSLYNKEKDAFDRFKRTGTPEFALYVLSNDFESFESKMEKANAFMQKSYKDRAKVETAKFDKLVSTSKKEREALQVTLGLNVDQKVIEKAREMISDSSNPYYYQTTKYPEKLSSIINDIK